MCSKRLDWRKLLNDDRRKPPKDPNQPRKIDEHRIELERDYDRILFSTPVRRLADKTQVFPLDRNDSVRTRLTHSHEVANLARSIGTALVYQHASELGVPAELHPHRSIPSLLGAIGLAHDLGNPPFGHQGEDAIRSWIKNNGRRSENEDGFGVFDVEGLDEVHRRDFLAFEGNAQAVRLLTRLQIIDDEFGLNMTYAFLAALLKYPVSSNNRMDGIHCRKKFNFFQSEADIVHDVWERTGLREGVRHPLTIIMEACDDIAYSVIDIEDAVKKRLISVYDVVAWLNHEGKEKDDETILKLCRKAEDRDKEYRGKKRNVPLSFDEVCDISMQMFRVDAIASMVVATTEAFVANIDMILSGQFEGELLMESKASTLANALKHFAKTNVYKHRSILEIELTGHGTIHALMDLFWSAIIDRTDAANIDSKREDPFSNYVFSRISENYRRAANLSKMPMRYRELQLMTDMISGMTDTYAVSLLKDLERFRG
ncbi:dGTP triphosphohydrolase [Methylosinus sp. LW4]|uniref:dGTP triphosphohydrolase n=1 Tax=Methylosinus sp. LW4 TaxID=136993 RepID=UPI0003A693C4|nr:dNTP triphosphohydrolase [Methylosinus sp. LW4]